MLSPGKEVQPLVWAGFKECEGVLSYVGLLDPVGPLVKPKTSSQLAGQDVESRSRIAF